VIEDVAAHILDLPPWLALVLVFALPALESSAFVGFVFPGEIALVLGGVLASEGRIALGAVLAAGIAGAAVGDSVGYWVGRRYGRRVLEGTLGRWINHEHFDRAERYLAARGGKAVFLSRFTAALRVLVPGLAGMAHMPYRTFAVFNLASAIGWGTLSVFLGFLGGRSWRHVASVSSHIGVAALGIVVLAVVVGHLMRRRRARAAPVDLTGPSPSGVTVGDVNQTRTTSP
jgi:membrane protein DedA with SNARE-associated domain